jgi:quercetin dioxygenase-like cupin family protein
MPRGPKGERARDHQLGKIHTFAERRVKALSVVTWLGIAWVVPWPATGQTHSPGHMEISGSPCRPISYKRSELGCYTLMTQALGPLPQDLPLFWHLDTHPTREAADAAKGPRSIVFEAFGRVWLSTIAASDRAPSGGRRVAAIGPIPLPDAAEFTAMYVEATFLPGGSVAAHRHSGPELWYTLSGEQCLETPDGKMVMRAGESVIVPGNTPMVPLAAKTQTPRSLILILHDSAQAPSTSVHDWTPKGLCRE